MKRLSRISVLSLVISSVCSVLIIPTTKASSDSTVTVVTFNQPTTLNPLVSNDNLSLNLEMDYLQRANFFYIDNTNTVVPNTNLGTYQVVSQSPYKIKYSINSGLVWSDGTPITAVDLLLDHIICSSRYSIAAGLGNPSIAEAKPAFNSLCYGGTYGERHVGLPTLSSDRMSLTIEYDRAFPEWLSVGPKPFPVHALVLASEGRTQLQNVSTSNSARDRFEKAFYGYDTKPLNSYGNTWSNSYKFSNNAAPTNPLLLVSSGGYVFENYIPGQSIAFKVNEKYGAGPELQGVTRVVYRIIPDGTQAFQALRNREVDIYPGLPTADSVATMKATPNVRVVDGSATVYEHLDLRAGTASGSTNQYSGYFAGNSQRAQDLRKAFLLIIPRDEIIEKVIRPVASSASRLDSLFLFSSDSRYQDLTSRNGISTYTSGSQAQREAEARSLISKYFPNVSASNPVVRVNVLWGTPTNSRRAAVAQLIRAAGARSGFDVNAPGETTWSRNLGSNSYDAAFFAWVRSDGLLGRNITLYCSTCGNNYSGWSNPTLDRIEQSLKSDSLSEDATLNLLVEAEREIYGNAFSIPLFQHPAIYGVNEVLQGFKPAPTSNPIVWNYWEWSKPGLKVVPRYLIEAPKPSPSPSPTQTSGGSITKPRPDKPIFSGVNFIDNRVNITVNIGSGTNRPDKVYLVAPKLGSTTSAPFAGNISGSTATWSIEFDKLLAGTLIPLEVVSEKDGVRSESNSEIYQAPALKPELKSVPQAPTNFKSRFVGNTAVVTLTAPSKAGAEATNAYLFGKSLGIDKSSAIEGEVVGSKVVLEVPIKNSMAGKKFPVTIYLANAKGESKPLNATLAVPAPAKKPANNKNPNPAATSKPGSSETIVCFRPNQTRTFKGSQCPPGYTEG